MVFTAGSRRFAYGFGDLIVPSINCSLHGLCLVEVKPSNAPIPSLLHHKSAPLPHVREMITLATRVCGTFCTVYW